MFGLIGKMIAVFRNEPALPRTGNVHPRKASVSPFKQPEMPTPPLADQNAAEALRRIFSRRDPAQAGSVHLIGVDFHAELTRGGD